MPNSCTKLTDSEKYRKNYKNAKIVGARYIEQSSYAQCLFYLPQCAGKLFSIKNQRASIYNKFNIKYV